MRHSFGLVFAFLLGCSGIIGAGDPGGADPDGAGAGPPDAASRWPDLVAVEELPMRRLTRPEIDATLDALVGRDEDWSARLPSDEVVRGFENHAAAQGFSAPFAEEALAVAERAAAGVVADLERRLPCATRGDRACADTFVSTFVARAWRRPVRPEEREALLGVHGVGEEESFARGIEMVATAALLSPAFWYRVEEGRGERDGKLLLSPYELAARLAFFLWGEGPDESLLELAASGGLETEADVAAAASRMLEDPRFERALSELHRQWLHLDAVDEIAKDPDTHPHWDTALPVDMRAELDRFVVEATRAPDATYASLLRHTKTALSGRLAAFLGAPAGEVDLPGRPGLLFRPGILALEGFTETSPVLRGHYVRQRLLCDEVPPPPPSVDNVPPPLEPNTTTRERIEARTSGPCSGCHRLMNPLGFAFEGWDASGLPRDTDHGLPIDASGEAVGTDIPPFDGLHELNDGLADSTSFRACVARVWLRFALGRLETVDDLPMLEALDAGLEADPRLRGLVLAIVRTDAFLTRPLPEN